MRPQAPVPPCHESRRSRRPRTIGQDGRKIYLPAEIPVAFQTGFRRFEEARPATREAHRLKHFGSGFAAESASYFPKIRESSTARDSREQQLKKLNALGSAASDVVQVARQVWQQPVNAPSRPASLQQVEPHSPVKSLSASSVVMKLDSDGMAALRLAFKKHECLKEKDFIAEMLHGLNAQRWEREQRINLTRELSTLYRQADLHAAGILTWDDFSTFLFQTADVHQFDEDANVQKFQADVVPAALNLPSEVQGMYYFEEVDQILLHDTRNKGFRMLRASSNTILGEVRSLLSSSRILDAAYLATGRYVITASTSPVISLYDIDHLRIRQQIPTDNSQTALELPSDPTIPRLYSACINGQVHVWNMDSLSCTHSFFTKGHEVMTDIAAIDDMAQVAASCLDGKIYMLDLNLGRVVKTLSGHKQGVTLLKYCSDNGYLVSGGLDHSLQVWNPHVEQQIGSLNGHRHQLVGLEIEPDTSQVITADESGLVKIWDLRKFAAVQTISREVYVRDHTLPRTLSRPMRAMCYMPSRKRIAIAHSSVFFLDQSGGHADACTDRPVGSEANRTTQLLVEEECGSSSDRGEDSKPIAVLLNTPSQFLIVVTARELQLYAVGSGQFIRRSRISLATEITCLSVVDDQYSSFVGTENGTLARLMLPSGSTMHSRKVHDSEIVAVKWVQSTRQVASTSLDGMTLILQSATLDVVHILHHWRGVQSVGCDYMLSMSDDLPQDNDRGVRKDTHIPLDLPVPLYIRSFFFGNEIDRFKALFSAADPTRSGKVASRKAKELLDRAVPMPGVSANFEGLSTGKQGRDGGDSVTFTVFLEWVKDKLVALQSGSTSRAAEGSGVDVVSIDVHDKLQQVVTVSPTYGTFCVWNLKSASVIAAGRAVAEPEPVGSLRDCAHYNKMRAPLIGKVTYLDPYPYYVLLEEGDHCHLSIWSSIAIPPAFPHTHQCILRLQYSNVPMQKLCDYVTISGTGAAEESKIGRSADCGGPAISCVEWVYGGDKDLHLLCVSDEQGFVTAYDFDSVRKAVGDIQLLQDPTSRKRGLVRVPTTEIRAPGELLPSSVLQIRCQWQMEAGSPIQSLSCIHLSHQVHKHAFVFLIVADNGKTSVFSLDGDHLGELSEQPSAPWLLHVEADELISEAHCSAVKMLRLVEDETKMRHRARQLQAKEDMLRMSKRASRMSTTTSAHEKDHANAAAQRPSFSRFLVLAKQL